ncbi:RUN and FYVE domain-containing protein 4 [Otolemur garnettii]|uniref:RUN and FYVE domain-containing protein 4 n=1 Tax=Otolemur garnettii TaxID=30611 RepID=UPI000273FDEE|nr:RUN and FYVE domain-containing protein 4 [Otolemur garnettii]
MSEEGVMLKVTKDLKAAVSAILQCYRDRQEPVTDACAELHRLCGCLELLLQFDQKEQKSFLGPRKDYWDFLCTALRQQRRDTEAARFVCSQDKLKTPLGKGRAFIRFCLVHRQLAEALQLCLLNPELTREWYGPRSPLLYPELQEDFLDSLYTLNGMAFNLDLQRQDLDEAWPMFSESRCSNSSQIQGRRPGKTKDAPKEIPAVYEGPTGVQLDEPHTSQASCLQDAPRGHQLVRVPESQQQRHLSCFLEKKKEDSRSLESSQSLGDAEWEELDQKEGAPWIEIFLESSTPSIPGQGAKGPQRQVIGREAEGRGLLPTAKGQRTTEGTHEGGSEWGHVQKLLASIPRGATEEATPGIRQEWEGPRALGESLFFQGLGTQEGSPTTVKPQKHMGMASVVRREEQAEVPLQDMVESLRHELQKAREQAECQEQLLREGEQELQALREQLRRCQEERALLQTQLEQKQQEAERRDAMYQEELGGQRDLIQLMKKRVLELIQEKDHLWQRLQHVSSTAPGCCVGCGKIFGRLSRRYPCRVCGGLLCHACSADYKKRERCCPLCAQGVDAHVP